MSQFQDSFDYNMNWEDPHRLCAVEPDACPEGCTGPCFAISGINSGEYPAQYAKILQATQNLRMPLVKDFYFSVFWRPMKLGGILFQPLVSRVYDEGVNAGQRTGVRILQEACAALGVSPGAADGDCGPLTTAAANSLNGGLLLQKYRDLREERYTKIVQENPSKKIFLDNWLERARA